MKIKIAYEKNERYIASALTEIIRRKLMTDNLYTLNIKQSERHKPYFHTYLNITSCNDAKK